MAFGCMAVYQAKRGSDILGKESSTLAAGMPVPATAGFSVFCTFPRVVPGMMAVFSLSLLGSRTVNILAVHLLRTHKKSVKFGFIFLLPSKTLP